MHILHSLNSHLFVKAASLDSAKECNECATLKKAQPIIGHECEASEDRHQHSFLC